MEYSPVQPAHLQQIRELNELFIELATRQTREFQFPALAASARRRLLDCDARQRAALANLPRALFQLEISQPPGRVAGGTVEDAVRCFAITALAVAFHMLRDSRFAARVLFAGSESALGVLTHSHLSQLMDYSALPGLISCPLLAAQKRASPLLAQRPRPNGRASQPSRIALGHALSMLSAGGNHQSPGGFALSSAS